MARRAQEFLVELQVEYVPIPQDRSGAWRANLLLLLNLLYEEREDFLNEGGNFDCDSGLERGVPALLPVEASAYG